MGRKSRPNDRLGVHAQQREFWLATLLRTLVTIAFAYVVDVFLQLVLVRVAAMPHGPLWSPEFAGPFAFFLTVGTAIALSIPYWMKEWDASLRSFSLFSSVGLLAVALFAATGQYDPNLPLEYLSRHFFVPLAHKLRYSA